MGVSLCEIFASSPAKGVGFYWADLSRWNLSILRLEPRDRSGLLSVHTVRTVLFTGVMWFAPSPAGCSWTHKQAPGLRLQTWAFSPMLLSSCLLPYMLGVWRTPLPRRQSPILDTAEPDFPTIHLLLGENQCYSAALITTAQ